ncbi:hypothetical protein [Enterococcus sp. DIV0170]|uniref:hypothetical protein n=1 Tax=Enterococcus sp. DIV0170 TaxID=2774642 RepID=UPI003F6864B4
MTLYQTNGHKSRKPTKIFKPFDIFKQRKNYFIYQQALIIKKELLLFNYFKKAEVEFLIQVLYG